MCKGVAYHRRMQDKVPSTAFASVQRIVECRGRAHSELGFLTGRTIQIFSAADRRRTLDRSIVLGRRFDQGICQVGRAEVHRANYTRKYLAGAIFGSTVKCG